MKKYALILLLLFAVIIIILTGYFILQKTDIAGSALKTSGSYKQEKDLLKKHKVSESNAGNQYYVKIKELVGSADTPGSEKYFKIDVTIAAENSKYQEMITENKEATIAIIRRVLLSFSTSDASSIKGKKFLKKRIENELEKKFGRESIKNVYFENFVYN